MSRRNMLIFCVMALANLSAMLVLAFAGGIIVKVLAAWWIAALLTLGGLVPIGSLMTSGRREEFDVES